MGSYLMLTEERMQITDRIAGHKEEIKISKL